MEAGLVLIFWYGVLYAFGPNHLAAIADFSIGKNSKKTMLITLLFAIGHGATLFLFVKLLEHYPIAESITGYGDLISSAVIIGMGVYLLFLVATDRIQLRLHSHEGKEHTQIRFGKKHSDNGKAVRASAFSIGTLMGMGVGGYAGHAGYAQWRGCRPGDGAGIYRRCDSGFLCFWLGHTLY